ncbi:hypothetical protein D9M70_576770 [compost metagenome]
MLLALLRSISCSVCTLTVLGTESTGCSIRVAVTVVSPRETASFARARDGLSNSKASQLRRAKGGVVDMEHLLVLYEMAIGR